MASGSSSSTDPGTEVAGFSIARALGDGLYEAVQADLGRRVALRRLAPGARFRATEWPEHAGVVDLFAAVEAPEGTYVATRFVPDACTMAERRASGASAAEVARWLDEAAATLDATGGVHGRLGDHEILIDTAGRVLLTGFGLAPDGATTDGDRAALARLRPRGRPSLLRALAAAAIATAAAVVVITVGLGGGVDRRPTPQAPPAVTPGATAVGSALASTGVATADCDDATPSGSSVSCTVMQRDLGGRPVVTKADGVVRAWAVRGVHGRVSLQVVRARGDKYVVVDVSAPVQIDDPAQVRVIRQSTIVKKGSRFALEVLPGSGVGVRRRASGARMLVFSGPLHDVARAADPGAPRTQELQLRVDVVAAG